MITGYATLEEERVEPFLQKVAPLLLATRDEPGCEVYNLSVDPATPGRILIQEVWASVDALRDHLRHQNFATTAQMLIAQGPSSVEVQKHLVERSAGMFGSDGMPNLLFD